MILCYLAATGMTAACHQCLLHLCSHRSHLNAISSSPKNPMSTCPSLNMRVISISASSHIVGVIGMAGFYWIWSLLISRELEHSRRQNTYPTINKQTTMLLCKSALFPFCIHRTNTVLLERIQ